MRSIHRRNLLVATVGLVLVCASSVPRVAGAATSRTRPRRASTTTVRPRRVTTTKAPTVAHAALATSAPTTSAAPVRGTVVVLAASSLGGAFGEMATAFEKANPGATVALSTAGSSTLVTQLRNGAPADVFASADRANMDDVVSAGLVDGAPAVFARNRLMIVVPKGNPMRVKDLHDLADPDVWVAIGAPGVPIGDYARRALTASGITVKPKTLEPNATAIVTKAVLHEIDAGIVYVTDVARDDYRVDGIAIPDAQNVIATYPIASVTTGSNRAGGSAFVAFVRSGAGQAILRSYKFLAPAGG